MGGSAGGALAAAVSRGGGLGFLSAGAGIGSGRPVRCRSSRAISSAHGYGEESAAGRLDEASNCWIGLKDVLAGEENHINIANEPWGNTNPDGWTALTIAAIRKLRSAGRRCRFR